MKTLLVLLALAGGASGFPEAVLFLTGASCIEELDAQVLERYEALAARPLDINSCPRSRLLSSGLFTPFQVASLVDYRSRSGDILSLGELALVDGFNVETAEALGCFVVLRSASPPGAPARNRVHDDLLLRGGLKGGSRSGDFKNILTFGEAAELSFTGSGTLSLALYGRSVPAKLIVGDFNARFAQGLASWSGFTMSGVPSASAFRKNGAGFSPSHSFSAASHRGIAADVSLRKWTLSAALSLPGLRDGKAESAVVMCNAARVAKTLTLGATAVCDLTARSGVVSADFRAGFAGVSLFGEAAASMQQGGRPSPAAVVGAMFVPQYGRKIVALARAYSPGFDGSRSGAVRSSTKVSDELALALGWQSPSLSSTLDLCMHPEAGGRQAKSITVVSHEFALGGIALKPSLRAALRLRPEDNIPLKSDLRADVAASVGKWTLSGRYNTIFYRGRSWLWYADAAFSKCHLRFTLFKVDDWDDRICAYEHDCAGCFTVPSYYGRGYSVSAFASKTFRLRRSRHDLSARARYVAYPWTDPAKPSAFELRVQYRLVL